MVWYLHPSTLVADSLSTICIALRLLTNGLGRISWFSASIRALLIPVTPSRNLSCIYFDRNSSSLLVSIFLFMPPELFEGSFNIYLRIDCPPSLLVATPYSLPLQTVEQECFYNLYQFSSTTRRGNAVGSSIAFGATTIFFLEHMFNLYVPR